jgi:hypothetical protein
MIAKCSSGASRRRGGRVSDGVVNNSELIVAIIDHWNTMKIQVKIRVTSQW